MAADTITQSSILCETSLMFVMTGSGDVGDYLELAQAHSGLQHNLVQNKALERSAKSCTDSEALSL